MASARGEGHKLFSPYFSTTHVLPFGAFGVLSYFPEGFQLCLVEEPGCARHARAHACVQEESPGARGAGKPLQGQECSPALPQLQPIS